MPARTRFAAGSGVWFPLYPCRRPGPTTPRRVRKPLIFKAFPQNGSLGYQAGNLGTFSLIGQYTDTQFQNRFIPLFASFQKDGYTAYTGGVHYEKQLDAAFTIAASLSETSLSYAGNNQNFSG